MQIPKWRLRRNLAVSCTILVQSGPSFAAEIPCKSSPKVAGPCHWVSGYLRFGIAGDLTLRPDVVLSPQDHEYVFDALPTAIAQRPLADVGGVFASQYSDP